WVEQGFYKATTWAAEANVFDYDQDFSPRAREYVSMSLSPRPERLTITRSLAVNDDNLATDGDPRAAPACGSPEGPDSETRSMRPAMAWADSSAGMMPSVRARRRAASRAAASLTAKYSARCRSASQACSGPIAG